MEMSAASHLTAADVLNAIPSAAVVLDDIGTIVGVNDAWLDLCAHNGEVLDDVRTGGDYLRVCADEAVAVSGGVQSVIDGDRARFVYEYSCHSPVEERWFRLVVTPLGAGALLVHQNVTGEYARISRWLSGTSVAVVELGPDLFSTYVNASWQRAMGVEDWMAPMGAGDAAQLRDRLRDCVRTGEGFSVDVRVDDGWYRFAVHPDVGPSGEVRRVVLVGFDVTSERRAVARSAAERERDRLAAELHDTVVQRLYATALALQRRSDVGYVSSDALEEAISRLDRSIGDLRAVGSPRRGTAATLDEAMREAVDDAAAALGFAPTVRVDVDLAALDPITGHHLIAVVSESLSNVARHAQAQSCEVDLVHARDGLVLTVTDDGRGMPLARDRRSGTHNIERRALDLGGVATWKPGPNGGTEVTWRVPLS